MEIIEKCLYTYIEMSNEHITINTTIILLHKDHNSYVNTTRV